MKFRKLKPEEIDVRVGTVINSARWQGVTLLLYKDARVDMDILDETVGSENWQRRHYEVKGNMYCSVGIKCDGEWVWKDDCGTESNTEKEKGEASDSFKRACVNWGIGRELYSSPSIMASCELEKDSRGKDVPKRGTTWYVSEIDYCGNEINVLEVRCKSKNSDGKWQDTVVFTYRGKPTDAQREECKELGINLENTARYFKVDADKLTYEQVQFAIDKKRDAILQAQADSIFPKGGDGE